MMPLHRTIALDVAAMAQLRGTSARLLGLLDTLLIPGTMAVILYRLSNRCYHYKLRPLSRLLYLANVVLFGADIAPPCTIGPGFVIGHTVGVIVAGPVVAGKNLRLFGQCGIGGSARRNIARDGFPVIGDDVVMFVGSRVLGPVTVGDGAWIAANAVVIDDVPAGATAVGVPARVRRFGRSSDGSRTDETPAADAAPVTDVASVPDATGPRRG